MAEVPTEEQSAAQYIESPPRDDVPSPADALDEPPPDTEMPALEDEAKEREEAEDEDKADDFGAYPSDLPQAIRPHGAT